MGINMPAQRAGSPIERLAMGLGVVTQGIDTVDKIWQGAKARDKEKIESDPTSQESVVARDEYSKYLGSPIAESISKRQLDEKYGGPAKFAEMALKNKYDKELIGLKGREERSTMATKKSEPKQLPPDKVLSVNEGNTIPSMLKEISQTIEANQKEFGPISGRAASLNPWNEKVQTIDAQMRAAAQAFGRYMEGGVLRKEDEEKYRKMFPNLSDTPEVAANKLAIVDKLLVEKQNSNVGALKAQGYDVSGIDKQLALANTPEILRGGKGALIKEANAGAAEKIEPQDVEALKWAKSNPKDPRASKIMNKLRMKGLE